MPVSASTISASIRTSSSTVKANENNEPKILVIVPAYNESANIEKVIDSLSNQNGRWDILVINDCSTDNTGEVAAGTGKATVINLPANLGIGGGVQTGFKYARIKGYDIALQFDGDGQHRADEIPKLLAELDQGFDVAIGSRFIERHGGFRSTRSRRMGIKIFELVNWLLIGHRITDNTSGFRAYNRKAISFLSQNYPADYPEPEAVVLLGKNGFKMTEVATAMMERQGGKSSIGGFRSVYYMVKVLLSVLMASIRPKVIRP
jgi:glycosyltransferase involved in cell wall biosynthesis